MSKIDGWFKRWMFDRKEGKITVTGFVDFWTIIHWGFWAFVASTIDAIYLMPWWGHLLYGVIGSYAWETIEYFLQRKNPERWSNRQESWLNSWISDPIFNLLGIAFGVFVVRFYRHVPFWR